MANSLYPAFVVIDEHSAFGAHKRTLPTRAWTGTTGSPGEWVCWDTSVADPASMIEPFVDLLAACFLATYNFDGYTIYTMDDPEAKPQPRYSAILDVPGTLASGDDVRASQGTMTFRTTAFGIFKLLFLDSVPSGDFLPQLPGSFTAAQLAVADRLAAEGDAWAGRDGGKIDYPLGLTWTLNEKLRRAYRLN